MERTKLDLQKVRKLPTANHNLNQKYGKQGTIEREQFTAEPWHGNMAS